MEVRIDVLSSSGHLIRSEVFGAPYFTVGGSEADALTLAGLVPRRFEFQNNGVRASVRNKNPDGSWGPWRMLPKAIVADLGNLSLKVTLVGGNAGTDQCPRCGHALYESASGGAYRSMARRTRECHGCGSQFLELHQTQDVLGAFADATSLDWFKATAPEPCINCRSPMQKAVFRTQEGQADVERCLQCQLVVLDPEDLAKLT